MRKDLTITVLVGLLVLAAAMSTSWGGEAGPYSSIVLREFSLEGADIQDLPEIRDFTQTLPTEFSQMVHEYLTSMKVPQAVQEEAAGKAGSGYENAVLVEGRFTKISAGSTAARWVVGFGAGASGVGAEWTVKDASTGKLLGKYNKMQRTGSSVRGVTAVQSDSRYLAKYVASTIQKLLK